MWLCSLPITIYSVVTWQQSKVALLANFPCIHDHWLSCCSGSGPLFRSCLVCVSNSWYANLLWDSAIVFLYKEHYTSICWLSDILWLYMHYSISPFCFSLNSQMYLLCVICSHRDYMCAYCNRIVLNSFCATLCCASWVCACNSHEWWGGAVLHTTSYQWLVLQCCDLLASSKRASKEIWQRLKFCISTFRLEIAEHCMKGCCITCTCWSKEEIELTYRWDLETKTFAFWDLATNNDLTHKKNTSYIT